MMVGPFSTVGERPWPLPQAPWSYYQEWRNAVFLHYRVEALELERLLPPGLRLDLLDGSAWVSLVAFDMVNVRPRWAPPFPPISDFHEVNLRTYVRNGSMPGVFFLRIDAANTIAVLLARALSVLPYRKAVLRRTAHAEGMHEYNAATKDGTWITRYRVGPAIERPTPNDTWLTARYCLYQPSHGELHRYQIDHAPWPLHELNVVDAPVIAPFDGIILGNIEAAHYSQGVKVLSWAREIVK